MIIHTQTRQLLSTMFDDANTKTQSGEIPLARATSEQEKLQQVIYYC